MKIVIVTATRPDIIKQAPVYWEATRRGHEVTLLHATQHYPFQLFEGVYKDMQLPFPPDYMVNSSAIKQAGIFSSRWAHRIEKQHPNVKISSHLENLALKLTDARPNPSGTVASIMAGCNKLFSGKLKDADIVLVHGDTMAAMAAALSAHLNLLAVGHVEAGLRTFSREPFPEQTDTRCADAASDVYFAATETNRQNLLNEGFDHKRVFVVGNSVVDAANWAKEHGEASKPFFESLGLDFTKPIAYFSAHRRENLLHKQRFSAITHAAMRLAEDGFQVLWSVRPGTLVALNNYGLLDIASKTEGLFLASDIPNYTDIMYLFSQCKFIATDSGSIQEESAALHVPCVTLRYVTDRPESVEAGVNVLAHPDSPESIMKAVTYVLEHEKQMRKAPNPYGKGDTSSKIIDALENLEGKFIQWEHDK
jgi:UDP-N-acetylglucosamine 2-epimerase (non-hydrolysing)